MLKNMKLGNRLYLLVGGIVFFAFIAFGIYIYGFVSEHISAIYTESINEYINDYDKMINLEVKAKQASLKANLNLAALHFKSLGSITESPKEFVSLKDYKLNKWSIAGKQVQSNFDIVDELKNMGVPTTTIFQKTSKGYVRITTNVISKDGSRAVGTVLGYDSPVVQTIERGEKFYGRAMVVGKWYTTAYESIRINGEIKGMIFVGVPEIDYSEISEYFAKKSFFGSGYPYLVDSKGIVTAHPKSNGLDISNQTFFKEIVQKKNGVVKYDWEGRSKTQYFKYIESIDSYITVGWYDSDYKSMFNTMKIVIGFATFIGLFLVLLILFIIVKNIVGSIKKSVEIAEQVSIGDFEIKLDIDQKDEVGQLAVAMRRMADTIKEMVSDIQNLGKSCIDGKLDSRAKADKYQGEFKSMIQEVNDTLDAVIRPLNMTAEYVDRISKGDIPPKITDEYKGDFNEIKNNLNGCIDAVNLLVSDASMLAKAAEDGKLDIRADAMKHGGNFREIISGVNETLDNVIGPLNVAAEYVDRISKGDIPPKITDVFKGDFNEIKNNLNGCIDAVNLLISDAVMLTRSAEHGNLDVRADSIKHSGHFREIINGVNQTLDNVIKPMKVAADFIAKVSRGDDLETITEEYKGDYNIIKNNINTSIAVLYGLIDQVQLLTNAAVEGKLDIRADVTKYKGGWGIIVNGFNSTLDAVIGPLNVAAEYVDRISKGDIPPKINDIFKGDFNEIKNNLNQCIDAVNSMIYDVIDIGNNIAVGKLRYRATAEKHNGDFRDIIAGINNSMDAVVTMIDSLPIPAMAIDNQFNILYMNELGAQLDNKQGKDLEGIKCFNHFKTSQCNTKDCACAVTIQNNRNTSNETDAHPGKHNLEIQYSAIPIRDKQGNAIGAFEVVMDQTEIKNSLKKMEKITKIQGIETQKFVEGFKRLAVGDFKVRIDLEIPDSDTQETFNTFNDILSAIRIFTKAFYAMRDDLNLLSKAAIEGKLDIRADLNRHNGELKEIVKGVNNTLDNVIEPLNVAAEYIDRISKGDIPPKITDIYMGDFNEIKNNLNQCIDAVNLLVADATLLTKTAEQGKLDVRADAMKHGGDFRVIISGVNKTLDNVIGPLNVAAEYVDRISKGDIPPKITDVYQGDFNEIKNNLNQCIDAVNLLVKDSKMLVNAAVAEKFDTRADASIHNGDFKKIVEGVNQTLDVVVNKIFWFEQLLDAIPSPVSVTDIDMNWTFINKAAEGIAGKTRKEILGKHCSNWGADICGTEKCGVHGLRKGRPTSFFTQPGLDMDFKVDSAYILSAKGEKIGHIEVVNDITEVTKKAEYNKFEIDRISKNLKLISEGNFNLDLKANESNNYTKSEKENFLLIYKDLEIAKNSIVAMANDSVMLSNATIEGKLDTRADANKHKGEYKRIIEGVNNTLDNVIGPLNVAAEYVDRISKGDIPPKIKDIYHGDFNEIKNNLNGCIDAVNALVRDALMLVKATEEGKLSTRVDATKHLGDFREIIEGVNKTLDFVIEPINEAGQVLEVMSTGDLTVRMQGEYKGDNQKLKNSINSLGSSLSDVIMQVNENVQTSASSAFQISSTAESLAAASQEQSAQTDEVASAIEEMSRTVSENAMSANRTADVARKSGEIATAGAGVVKQTVNKMKDIADVVQTSANNIQKLGDSSQEIGEIISVIDDIADQTNLLALNAAIEAARAGEQGRGFAVVADEVRKLAERTTEATKQIAKMIKGIQKETDQAVVAMNRGTLEVQNGIDLADKAGESLNHILTSTQDVLDMINQIAAASEEQSATSEQISKNVMSISKVTGESAQRVEDVARTSEELAKLTEQLRNMMSQFTVEGNASYSYAPTKQLGRKDRKHLPA